MTERDPARRGDDEGPPEVALLSGLRPGERVVVRLERPDALLDALRADPGRLSAGVLQREGRWHRLEVERLAARRTPTISGHVGWDQRRLDDLLEDVDDRVAAHDFRVAHEHYLDFRAGLLWHMEWEEQVLVPALRRLCGEGDWAKPEEHGLIRAAAEVVAAALARADARAFNRSYEELLGIIGSHEFEEEVVLYPRLDALLTPPEAQRLILEGLALEFRPDPPH